MTGQSLRSPCIRPSTCTADAHRGSEVRHLYRRVGRRVDPRGPTCFRARAQEQRPPMRVQLSRSTRTRLTIAPPPSVLFLSILPDAKSPLRNSRCATRAGHSIGGTENRHRHTRSPLICKEPDNSSPPDALWPARQRFVLSALVETRTPCLHSGTARLEVVFVLFGLWRGGR